MIVLVLFIGLLIAFPAYGQTVIIAKKKTDPYTYCTACPDGTAGGDQVCEMPDGTADGLCGWTIVEAGGATGDINAADSCDNSPALGCNDILMTYCISAIKTNTTDGEFYAYKSIAGNPVYAQFYIKILDEGLADSETTNLISFASSGDVTTNSVKVNLYQDGSSNLTFGIEYHEAGGWTADVSTTAISLDTWYGIRVHINDSSDSVQWWVDYNLDGTFTDEGTNSGLTLDRAIGYFVIGQAAGQGSGPRTQSWIITGIKVDDDSMPGDCAR